MGISYLFRGHPNILKESYPFQINMLFIRALFGCQKGFILDRAYQKMKDLSIEENFDIGLVFRKLLRDLYFSKANQAADCPIYADFPIYKETIMTGKNEKQLTPFELCSLGKEKLKKMGVEWLYPGGKMGASVLVNHKYLKSLFFEPKFLNPVEVSTTLNLFGVSLRTPVLCSAISRRPYMPKTSIVEIARGISNAGSLIMLGIGGPSEMQRAIDTGANVVKVVKPYRKTDVVYRKIHDAETRGCVAVGMDIDHSYGILMKDKIMRRELFGVQQIDELKQVISQIKLPFIFKGVLSVCDAKKALELGASGIVVSNHGSGAFDYTTPSLIALPKIVDSVGDKLTVIVDTGFESGSDVFKALALGAKAVGFASSMVLAFMGGGSTGVECLVNQITAELHRTMEACGFSDLGAIQDSILIRSPFVTE